MAKKEGITYEQLLSELKSKQYRPVYLLMGEEPYYIDRLSDFIQNNVLDEMEKEFNQTILYGKESTMAEVINAAKRFPMMSPHQVIIVKEAQHIKDYDLLSFYLQKPLQSTILVFCYKYGSIDRRKKIVSEIEKTGIVFQSDLLRDYQLPAWIKNYVKSKNLTIDEKATALLAEFLGADLSRIVGELDKLVLTKPANTNAITCELIEKNIGISKEYNNFELQNAIMKRDILKINRIADYFAKNPKNNPLVVTLSVLFGFYSNLLLFHYSSPQSRNNDNALAGRMGVNPFFVKDYRAAATHYNARKCMQNIALLREFDAKTKGIDSKEPESELVKELLYKLIH
ncbi:MAG: DNA polymerase III subunit delta [Prevotellaceae bacterium]|jgi:DNA polymerase-3 subunit delta|nr:DNA polymerase III subunit delta [Prevotellaceae bacterium]